MVDEYEFDELEREVDDLRSTVSQFGDERRSLARRVGELEDQHVDLVERVDSLSSELGEVPSDLADQQHSVGSLRATLARLEGRVDWLEQQVHAGQGLSPIDLDDSDAGVKRLVQKIRAGIEARADLLDERRRGDHSWVLQERERHRNLRLGWMEAAIEHSRKLADSYDEREAHAFDGLYDLAIRETEHLETEKARYEEARTALATDDRRRAGSVALLQAEAKARQTLVATLRDRISEALKERRLLPVWLTAELGYGPTGDSAWWLRLAAEVLLYRIVYEVGDPVVALGSAPDPGRPGQKDWYEQLLERLRRQR